MTDLFHEIEQIVEESDKRRDALEARIEKLRATPEYQEAAKRAHELELQRDEKWAAERKALADAARELYGARHRELQSFARSSLPGGAALGFNVLNYPRVDGSTSTQPLGVIIAARLLGTDYEWVYPEPTGSRWSRPRVPDRRFLDPIPVVAGGSFSFSRRPHSTRGYDEFDIRASTVIAKPGKGPAQERLAIMINSLLAATSSTHDAFVNVVDGKVDLVLNVRGPSASEQALAAKKGVRFELTPVAKDALVFIVNVKNPMRSRTEEQLVKLYSEEFTWRGIDERRTSGKLTPYTRDRDSGSRELFDALVMKGRPGPKEESPDLIAGSMGGPYNQVTEDETGIGYSVYYYEHFMAASPLTRTIAVNGVEPTPETIASGKYPYVTPVYAIRRAGEPEDSAANQLLKWILSDEGQAVVRESGYVPARGN